MKHILFQKLKKFSLTLAMVFCLAPSLTYTVYAATKNNQKDVNYSKTLKLIAGKIEELKSGYPQLVDFSTNKNSREENLSIVYAYHTHKAEPGPGWISGVPNPDEDGVWFYIDIHHQNSTQQIHTQPRIGRQMCLRNKHVSFLILEGKRTKTIEAALWAILRQYGVQECKLKFQSRKS